MLSAWDVGNYFLILNSREDGDLITQLKLQKLVYYAQGISLALRGAPFFDDPIEAWERGPVVRSLRHVFGGMGSDPLPVPAEMDFERYSDSDKAILCHVMGTYGEHSAFMLSNMTHEHRIWQKAFKSLESKIISVEAMRSFFLEQLREGEFSEDCTVLSKESKAIVDKAEDEWWMQYDCGIEIEPLTREDILSA